MRFNPTTPLLYFAQEAEYIPGEGQNVTWKKVLPKSLYAEWRGGFGDRALSAHAMGVSDMATVKTFYHPTLYKALAGSRVLVIKNGDVSAVTNDGPKADNQNLYEIWGGVDNVGEADQFMEFRARRYEAK